jgi:TRAP-type C4-dicarboxylate transport system permease small subunit
VSMYVIYIQSMCICMETCSNDLRQYSTIVNITSTYMYAIQEVGMCLACHICVLDIITMCPGGRYFELGVNCTMLYTYVLKV